MAIDTTPPPPRSLSGLALAAASLLGLGWPAVTVLRASQPTPPGPIALIEGAFSSFRTRLPPGARVGVLLATDPRRSQGDLRAWYVGQYALAPAVVRPIVGTACAGSGLQTCGVLSVDYLIVNGSVGEGGFQDLRRRAGFTGAAQSRGLTLLVRERR